MNQNSNTRERSPTYATMHAHSFTKPVRAEVIPEVLHAMLSAERCATRSTRDRTASSLLPGGGAIRSCVCMATAPVPTRSRLILHPTALFLATRLQSDAVIASASSFVVGMIIVITILIPIIIIILFIIILILIIMAVIVFVIVVVITSTYLQYAFWNYSNHCRQCNLV
jgi:hypothetical protein